MLLSNGGINEKLSHGHYRCFIVYICPNYVALNCNGGFMMKKYIVQASEVVYYEIEVEAESSADAHEKVLMGHVEIPEPIDGSDFTIGFIDEAQS